jgi:hypothetical protein
MMSSVESEGNEMMWKARIENNSDGYPTRKAALVAAHDMVKEESYPIEYGVIEI